MTARYDVVVVGGGFAGSLVAKVLGERGRRVLVLEAGAGSADSWQDHQDALHTYHTSVLRTVTSSYHTTAAAPSTELTDYLLRRGEMPYVSSYLRVNGGTGNAWAGMAPRMHPEDFRAGDLGPGRNWPIGYDDLEPFYRAAEREIGVSADVDELREGVGLPFGEDYVYPMHGLPRSHLDEVVARSVDGRSVHDPFQEQPIELRVVGFPHARNGHPNPAYDNGRGYVPDGSRCVGFASCLPICPEQAKYTPLRTQARWSDTVTLHTRAVVNRLHADSSGRITEVHYQRYTDDTTGAHSTHVVEADLVVLAAHSIENAKLLLLSGLANSSGQVGRNLMDHPILLTWGLAAEPVGPYRGPGTTSGIEGFRFGAARRDRAPFQIEIGNWGWVWAAGPPARDLTELLHANVFGTQLRQRLADRVGRQFALHFEIGQEADPDNRVTVDRDLPDLLGNPRPVVHYGLSDHVKRGLLAAKRVSDQIFTLLGAEDHTRYSTSEPGYFEFDGQPLAYRGAGHGAGTHIMGDSPGDSVVDQWQRCWDHPNLYAIGCGSMPSMGTSNPSLTMAALALRSAEHIAGELAAIRRVASR